MQNYAITQEKLDWYSKIKQELGKYGILVDDISKLGAMVNNVAKIFGYNATKLGDALSNFQALENDCQWYERRLKEERDERDILRNQRSRLQAGHRIMQSDSCSI